jgi:hypothetical protein
MMGRSKIRFLKGLLVVALATALTVFPDTGWAQKGKGKGKGKAKKAEAAETTTAEQPAAPPAEDVQAKAREHYSNGKALYEKGSFADAMAEFQIAYDLKPHPSVLKSIAECKVQMGDIPGAIAMFEKFLADPISTKKEDVQAKVAELKAMMARVDVTSAPNGASVMIDGAATDKVTPATIELAPGEHHIVLNVDGYQPLEKGLTLAKGERGKIDVDFAKDGTSTAPKTDTALVDPFATDSSAPPKGKIESESAGPPAGFWIAAAVAGVGLVSGTVFGTLALGDEKDFQDKKDATPVDRGDLKDIKDSGERNGIIADVSFGVAAAAAVVGVIVLLTHKKGEEKADAGASAGARVNVVPVATGDAVGMTTAVSF